MAMILLPLVGFTRAGARLGTGGGYYDRSLAFRLGQSAPPLLVGVGYALPGTADAARRALGRAAGRGR
jgi:5-formyltetrahydrofolate cyclo-ligase